MANHDEQARQIRHSFKRPKPCMDESGHNESIEKLEDAECLIKDAISLIQEAVQGRGQLEASVKAYLVGHLKNSIGEGNPYDQSIQQVIEKIRKEI